MQDKHRKPLSYKCKNKCCANARPLSYRCYDVILTISTAIRLMSALEICPHTTYRKPYMTCYSGQ